MKDECVINENNKCRQRGDYQATHCNLNSYQRDAYFNTKYETHKK